MSITVKDEKMYSTIIFQGLWPWFKSCSHLEETKVEVEDQANPQIGMKGQREEK